MLIQLDIENVAVFEKASIAFEKGLNALTGETGAGKSLIINSLNMVLGARAAHGIIRAGADFACVSAVFFDKNIDELLSDMGIECDGGNVVISRKIYSDGRNLCRINGTAVAVSDLRTVGSRLVVIHGQRENAELLNAQMQLSLIDSFSENEVLIKEYRNIYSEYKEASLALDSMNIDEKERLREIDYLQFQINELKELSLSAEEEEELTTKKNLLENAEELASLSSEIHEALGGDGGAKERLYTALLKSEKLSGIDGAAVKFTEQLSNIYYEIEELSRDSARYAAGVEFDTCALDAVSDRLDAINTIKRKYAMDIPQIIEYEKEAQNKLEELISFDENKEELEKKVKILKDRAQEAAKRLSGIRKKASLELSEKINSELKFLDMAGSEISFSFEPCALSLNGLENTQMLFSSNGNSAPMPIGKIASGGELSRIMLAIKSVFCDFDRTPTLLFDEIDTGVSGRAAEKIALKMRELAYGYQLICVTHLPIIAAAAENHILIEKYSENGETKTKIIPLTPCMRESEIARMISGDNISGISLANARQMLSSY